MKQQMSWKNLYQINAFKDVGFLKEGFFKRKNLLWIWMFLGIIPAFIFYLSSRIENSLILPSPQLGFLSDSVFLSYFIFIPAVTSMAVYYFPNFKNVLHGFKDVVISEHNVNRNIKSKDSDSPENRQTAFISEEKFNDMLKSAEDKIVGNGKMKYLKIAFFIGGVLWVAVAAKSHWFAIDTYGRDIWSSQTFRISFFIRTLFELVMFGYLFPLIIYKYLMILHTIRSICRQLTEEKVLKLRPLNPDKAGGLGFIGKYSFNMTSFLLPMLIPIIFYMYLHDVNIILSIGLTLYIPILVFAFFYPLSGAHEVMKDFKNRELNLLTMEFNNVYDHLVNDIMLFKASDLPTEYEILDKIESLYNKADKMPVWPFDTKTLTKFISIISATLSAIWLEWIVKLLSS